MAEKKIIEWYCINHSCGEVIGNVLGSELLVNKQHNVESVQSRGPNLVVKCGNCGTQKVWYTSDPIVRSIYQLVDATVSIMANRMLKEIGEKSK